MAVPGPKGIVAATGPEGSEAQQATEEAQEGVVATPGPEETTAEKEIEGGDAQQAPGGAQGGARGLPVACVTGVPREPANGGEVARITRPGGRTPPETLEQVNQQYLKSKYKFKEGAPLKEYLQQRISSFREPCTLVEVLTWLKEIIRDNLLFDERNPAMIVGDAPLEAALRKKKVHGNDIRSVVIQQLTMVEARQGPWNLAMLIGGMTRLGRVPAGPRPEVQAATAPASTQGVRVMSLTEVPTSSVVLRSPASGITEVPARSVVMHNPIPGIQQEIGTVSYTAPARPAAGQNAGGVATAAMSSGAGFTGVRIRPLMRMPGASRGPPLSREAAASISQVIVTLTLLLANAGPTDGFMAYSCEDMRSPMVGYELTPQAGCWMKQPTHANLKPRDGRIVWMRDGAQFPVIHCKMTETVMQADCGTRGELGP